MSIAIGRLLHCFLMQFQKRVRLYDDGAFWVFVLFVLRWIDVARMSHFIHLR